jgi:hypothetical protein
MGTPAMMRVRCHGGAQWRCSRLDVECDDSGATMLAVLAVVAGRVAEVGMWDACPTPCVSRNQRCRQMDMCQVAVLIEVPVRSMHIAVRVRGTTGKVQVSQCYTTCVVSVRLVPEHFGLASRLIASEFQKRVFTFKHWFWFRELLNTLHLGKGALRHSFTDANQDLVRHTYRFGRSNVTNMWSDPSSYCTVWPYGSIAWGRKCQTLPSAEKKWVLNTEVEQFCH